MVETGAWARTIDGVLKKSHIVCESLELFSKSPNRVLETTEFQRRKWQIAADFQVTMSTLGADGLSTTAQALASDSF